jgi:pimeloyl-ACP methyl ester carboxylesterase
VLAGAGTALAETADTRGMAATVRDPVTADLAPLSPIAIPPQAPAKTGLAQLPGVKLWYWDTGGAGEPVILLHPMTGSAQVWSYQQPALVRAGYRVVAYSRRGFHGSEAGPAGERGTGAEDLHQLRSVLGITRFHAVASAAGAFVAAAYAVAHPEHLLSLTLACSILGVEDPALAELTNGLRTPGFEALPAHFRELGPSYRACNPEGTRAWQKLERTSSPGPRVEQPAGSRLTLASLESLRMPTLLISGDSDLIAPPPVARLFARHIPHYRLEVVAESGHSAYWERPDLFNTLVTDFLRHCAV